MIGEISFTTYAESVFRALDQVRAKEALAGRKRVLIKPNLVEAVAPPVTTHVDCVAAIVDYVRAAAPSAEIIVAEGCAAANYDTCYCFEKLGYNEMAVKKGVALLDLNYGDTVLLRNPTCSRFPEFRLPRIAIGSFILSVPCLKAHSLAVITGTLKNMMGFAQPEFYQQGGHWKKSVFHTRMHESIRDLSAYRKPDLSVVDARIGLSEYHLGGPECQPPVDKILAGYDPLEIDRRCAELLGFDWQSIPHLADDLPRALAV
jgi:uncharacterized protein (DUF362 family)